MGLARVELRVLAEVGVGAVDARTHEALGAPGLEQGAMVPGRRPQHRGVDAHPNPVAEREDLGDHLAGVRRPDR